ncbi:hypothetical protein BGX27_003772 [Mortierella sp. AM989]|nr:hypothetical protein BGX27_003772 [Mortierella sp. AM989]
MKITTISAVMCLAATTAFADRKSTLDTPRDTNALEKRIAEAVQRRPLGLIRHEDDKDGKEKQIQGDDKKKNEDKGEEKEGHDDGEEKDGKTKKDGKDVADEKSDKDVTDEKDGKAPADAGKKDDKAATAPVSTAPSSNPSRDYSSSLWMVQPYGASVWEQGRDYIISWGPNPDPVLAKNLKAKTLVDVHLMQGTAENLREVAVIKSGVDSSTNMYQWKVPKTVTPAKDYSIRLTHGTEVDTYSHYFEVVKAGDTRSSKSNVGEPLQMPQKGDLPQDKGSIIKPSTPPNPFPAEPKTGPKTPAPVNPPPVAAPPVTAKPIAHASAATESRQSANIMVIALTLFGAVYML